MSAPVRSDRRPRSAADQVAEAGAGDVLVVWRGDVDLASGPVLAAGLALLGDVGVRVVLLDVSDVTFMDCAGLGLLIHADAVLDHGLVLVRPSLPVRRLLALVELTDHFATTDVPPPVTPRPDTRATIEQARGLIMGSYGCTADQAGKILLSTALQQNVQVQVLASLLQTVASSDQRYVRGGTGKAVRRIMGAGLGSPDVAASSRR